MFRSAALLVAAGLAVVSWRAPLWDLPLERDEGDYAYIAWRLAEGEMPYRDWFDQKPPGVHVAYRAALALPGDPVASIRALAALFCAASALALFGLVRDLLGPAAGAAAAALLVLLSADPMLQGPIANTELFMGPGIVVAAWLTLRALAARWPAGPSGFAVGLALGAASAFKQVALVNAPFLLAVFWWRARGPGRLRRSAAFGGGMAAGGLGVWAAIGLWLAAKGALGPALDAILLHNLDYVAQLGLAQRVALLRHHVGPLLETQGAAWALAGVGLSLLVVRGPAGRFPALFLGGFAAFNAVGTSASGLYFPHYFQQMLPAIAALAGGVAAGPGHRRLRGLAIAAALLPLVASAVVFWRLDPAEATRRIYPDAYFEAMPALAGEIAAHTAPDERVFVFGSEPELLFGARRVSASRYIFLDPVYAPGAAAAERQAALIAELEAAPPAAVVWVPNARMQAAPGRPQELTRWTVDLLQRSYRLHAAVAAVDGSRGLLRHVEPGVDPFGGARPWAILFLRTR